jgi:hypothetical protein
MLEWHNLEKGNKGQKGERNKTIILMRVTRERSLRRRRGEADRGGVRWMNTSSNLFLNPANATK